MEARGPRGRAGPPLAQHLCYLLSDMPHMLGVQMNRRERRGLSLKELLTGWQRGLIRSLRYLFIFLGGGVVARLELEPLPQNEKKKEKKEICVKSRHSRCQN